MDALMGLQFNVLPPAGLAEADKSAMLCRCEAIIFEIVYRLGGSISAEYGIGRVKRDAFLSRSTALDMALLRGIKETFAPSGLMNQGRLFN